MTTSEELVVPDVMSVGPTWALLYRGSERLLEQDLTPNTEYDIHGATFRTLAKPAGTLISRFATVNDVHFGETEAGKMEGTDIGPVLSVEPGATPYPQVMNDSIAHDMAAHDVDLVVVKGDLTASGTDEQFEAFRRCYEDRFKEKLLYVRGNHDAYQHQNFAAWPTQLRELPGCTVALLDTTLPGSSSGQLSADQLEWLADSTADQRQPVVVLGHHHVWDPGSTERHDNYFGIHPDWSERLIELTTRHPRIVAYAAGHTHRNRVRRFAATGEMPWIEVACAKDFPGSWATYEVYEGGILQIHHRASSTAAIAWSERCREMFFGLYADYALGTSADRCFEIPLRRAG